MDDGIRLNLFYGAGNRILICNIQLDIWSCGYSGSVAHTTVDRLNVRSYTLMPFPLQLVDNIMSKLSSNSCYEYLHIHTLLWAATASDGFISSFDQFQHYVMPKLTGDSCYKYFQLYLAVNDSHYLCVRPHSGV